MQKPIFDVANGLESGVQSKAVAAGQDLLGAVWCFPGIINFEIMSINDFLTTSITAT